MAGNTVYVSGNYVDVHDNEVVNLQIDKAVLTGVEQQQRPGVSSAVLAEPHQNKVVDAIHELTDVVKESLKKPKNEFKVYPQAGSTANVGCEMKQPEFKVIPPPKEQQPALESNREGGENV